MEWQDCKFIAIDLGARQVIYVDNKTGEVLGRFDYPKASQPVFLAAQPGADKAVLAVSREDEGSIFILSLHSTQSYRLPVKLPSPMQFTMRPDFKAAYFVSQDAILYRLDMTALTAKALAQPSGADCVGICCANQRVYTAWEASDGGVVAAFAETGEFLHEYKVSGIPTNLCVRRDKILVPFTESHTYGEGLAILSEKEPPVYRTFQAASASRALHVYPCNVTIDEAKGVAYVVNEDSGSITMLRVDDYTVCDQFAVGRSITNLCLLPDSRFAIATSNMFADLSMLDLVNRKLLSVTDRSQELSSLLAVLPPDA